MGFFDFFRRKKKEEALVFMPAELECTEDCTVDCCESDTDHCPNECTELSDDLCAEECGEEGSGQSTREHVEEYIDQSVSEYGLETPDRCCGERIPVVLPDGFSEPDPYRERIDSATNLGMAGKKKEATLILREIVKENNQHSGAWYALAKLFTEMNEVGRALHCYEQITRVEPRGMASGQVRELRSIVLQRPDYVWEYNKERGAIK